MFVSYDYGKTWTTMENPMPYDWLATAEESGDNLIGYRPIMVLGADSIVHLINTTEGTYSGSSRVRHVRIKVYD
jgi:hypothetical protein